VARQVPTRHTFSAMAIALLGVMLVITKGRPGDLLHGAGHGGELLMLLGCRRTPCVKRPMCRVVSFWYANRSQIFEYSAPRARASATSVA
jgi:hypothetical protein